MDRSKKNLWNKSPWAKMPKEELDDKMTLEYKELRKRILTFFDKHTQKECDMLISKLIVDLMQRTINKDVAEARINICLLNKWLDLEDINNNHKQLIQGATPSPGMQKSTHWMYLQSPPDKT